MKKFRIRFNKSAGQAGRGSKDHVWRVFDETGKEYLVKNIFIKRECWGEKESGTEDWNMVAIGEMEIDRVNSLITII